MPEPNLPTSMRRGQLVVEVNEHDVFLGRGKNSFFRPGNITFRKLTAECQVQYVGKQQTKEALALEVIATIKKNGGRFLRPITAANKNGEVVGAWEIVGHDVALMKTKQAIRDAAHSRSRRSKRDKEKQKPAQTSPSGAPSPEDPAFTMHHKPYSLLQSWVPGQAILSYTPFQTVRDQLFAFPDLPMAAGHWNPVLVSTNRQEYQNSLMAPMTQYQLPPYMDSGAQMYPSLGAFGPQASRPRTQSLLLPSQNTSYLDLNRRVQVPVPRSRYSMDDTKRSAAGFQPADLAAKMPATQSPNSSELSAAPPTTDIDKHVKAVPPETSAPYAIDQDKTTEE